VVGPTSGPPILTSTYDVLLYLHLGLIETIIPNSAWAGSEEGVTEIISEKYLDKNNDDDLALASFASCGETI